MSPEYGRDRIAMTAVTPAEIIKLILGALGLTAVIGVTAEAVQSAVEFGRLVADPVFFGFGVPRGDGHPVMVIPGFLGSDGYLNPMRGWLERIGYRPLASGLERNTGFNAKLLSELEARAADASSQSGRPISIIGHSLGGVYARAIARRNPEAVRAIVTMGSPLGIDAGLPDPPIPFTAIYSRSDRIVRHPRALARAAAARNVEVTGCHVGMAFNPAVYRVIGKVLGGDFIQA